MDKSISIKLVAAALMASLAIAGCGGSDEDGGESPNGSSEAAGAESANSGSENENSLQAVTPAARQIPKKQFVKKAEAICEKTIKDITTEVLPPLQQQEEEGEDTEANRAELEAELVSTVALPKLRTEVKQIAALGTPPGDKKEVSRVLDSFVELIEETEGSPETLVGSNEAFAKPARIAENYGLISCPFG